MSDYITIEIPTADLDAYEDALRWAMQEAEHHVEIAGDPEARHGYERDAKMLGRLFDGVQSVKRARQIALGKEPE